MVGEGYHVMLRVCTFLELDPLIPWLHCIPPVWLVNWWVHCVKGFPD